jgi:hypothetical protein
METLLHLIQIPPVEAGVLTQCKIHRINPNVLKNADEAFFCSFTNDHLTIRLSQPDILIVVPN